MYVDQTFLDASVLVVLLHGLCDDAALVFAERGGDGVRHHPVLPLGVLCGGRNQCIISSLLISKQGRACLT